jgi:hypothetical protein
LNYFARFVGDIDFTKGAWKAVTLKVSTGDGWAVESPAMTFGWVVNPMTGVGKETFTIPGLENGDYDIYLYSTWGGSYLPAIAATSAGGALTMNIPDLTGNQNLHEDVAFKLVKKGAPITAPRGSDRP